jgi:hypothetical protein
MIYHDKWCSRDTNGSRRNAVSAAKEKFATQVSPEILAEIRAIAQDEGRQLQALVDEALADLIEKRRNTRPRPHVMSAYHASHEQYATLYGKLAT